MSHANINRSSNVDVYATRHRRSQIETIIGIGGLRTDLITRGARSFLELKI
jgi:hypothetical protein